jgi:hypothetical protein
VFQARVAHRSSNPWSPMLGTQAQARIERI